MVQEAGKASQDVAVVGHYGRSAPQHHLPHTVHRVVPHVVLAVAELLQEGVQEVFEVRVQVTLQSGIRGLQESVLWNRGPRGSDQLVGSGFVINVSIRPRYSLEMS